MWYARAVDIASEGKNENARIAAATAILDRGYGRPAPIPLKELEPTDLPPMVIKLVSSWDILFSESYYLYDGGRRGSSYVID